MRISRGERLVIGRSAVWGVVVVALGAGIALAQTTGTITLTGTVATNCNLVVTPASAASSLDLSNGVKRVQVGSVLQNCNKNAGYLLIVASLNCPATPTGAKLVGALNAEVVPYSVEANNPTTGGSQAVVTGLLATACSGAAAVTARDVAGAKITGETSQIFVNYSGSSGLSADSYADTLTITLAAK